MKRDETARQLIQAWIDRFQKRRRRSAEPLAHKRARQIEHKRLLLGPEWHEPFIVSLAGRFDEEFCCDMRSHSAGGRGGARLPAEPVRSPSLRLSRSFALPVRRKRRAEK